MKIFKKWPWAFALCLVAVGTLFAGDRIIRYPYQGSTVYDLRSDCQVLGVPLKLGNTHTGSSVTLPTTTTGSNFAIWLPVYNIGAAVTAGDVLCSSNTGTGYIRVCPATSGVTTVVGVAAEAIASGASGWIVPVGYAVAHTTGTVAIGDILVTTTAASGYLATNNSPTSGTVVAKALSAGTAAGGSALVLMK